MQRQLGADILITGHTHQFKAYRVGGRLLLNPGSATGAYTAIQPLLSADGSSQNQSSTTHPSFVLLDIDGPRAVIYIYELVGDEVKVDKIEYKKLQNL